MRKIAWILAATLLALGLAWGAALGEEAEAPDLTGDCSFTLCASKYGDARLRNGDYTKGWESKKIRNPYVVIHSEKPMYGLYLCFRQMPTSWELQVKDGEGKDDWKTLIPGDTRFHHTFYELDGLRTVRIYSTQEKAHVMGFNEIYVFGRGRIPDWVQRWEEPVEKADILFLSAHQDDELIFFGGGIPTYAVERGKRVLVAYMALYNGTRRSEALNGLWSMGIRNYPVFSGFKDTFSSTAKDAYKKLGKDKVLGWITELLRKHQPEVVVTHDLNGEYGHGQHKMTADAAIQGYTLAADPAAYPESAEKYGTWQVKKLYVHLYGDESVQTKMDWTVPLKSLGGKTGLEAAEEAFALHVSQQTAEAKVNGKWRRLSVETHGTAYSNTTFGLYASQVGPDETHTDFLEHID